MRKMPFSTPDLAAISTLGMEFAVAVALGTGAGFWWDRTHQTFPWITILGVCGGFALGMYIIVKEAKRLEKANCRQDKK